MRRVRAVRYNVEASEFSSKRFARLNTTLSATNRAVCCVKVAIFSNPPLVSRLRRNANLGRDNLQVVDRPMVTGSPISSLREFHRSAELGSRLPGWGGFVNSASSMATFCFTSMS